MEAISSFWFNTQFMLERIPHIFRLKSLNEKMVRPSITVNFENDLYQVKTADSLEEIIQVLSLRFEVFFREFSTNKVTFTLFPYDIDMHDFICDHLIVKEKVTNNVVACYRLLSDSSEKNVEKFYSEGEFGLGEFLAIPGRKLELGRACVHKDYRKGTVVSLLWRGLLDYAKKNSTKYMFGCSSLNRKDFQNLPHIMEWLKKNDSFINDFKIDVCPKYSLESHPEVDLKFSLSPDEKIGTKALGSLMHMYIMAGAKVGNTLAYDAEMDCLDFFTVIDLEKMPSSFERRFSV